MMAQYDTFDRVPSDWRELLVLDAAVSCGLVDALSVRRSAAGLAGDLGLDERATVAVLDALVALGYAAFDRGGYVLTEEARGFLCDATDPRFRRHSVAHNAYQLRRWMQLHEVLLHGGPAVLPEEGRDLERFLGAMDDVSRPAAGCVVDALLDAAPGARRVLDVGGGPGTYARELARRGVACVVFDVAEVVALMAPRFADTPLVTYEGGDLREELPDGPFDVVLIANVVHIFGPETGRSLVARAARSIAPGGVLALFDFVSGRSARAALFAVNMLVATAEGRTYREAELRQWCEGAGTSNARALAASAAPRE